MMLAALITAPLFTGCGDPVDDPQAKITITSTETTLTFLPGEAMEKTLTFESAKGWQLSHPAADWVDITPKNGDAGTISLTIKVLDNEPAVRNTLEVAIVSDEARATFNVVQEAVVPVAVNGVEIIGAPGVVYLDEAVQLQTDITPEGAIPQETVWSSSDDAVISVTQGGLITALSVGTATISVTIDGYSDEAVIEVKETFESAGDGTRYTFTMLSGIGGSGVTVESGDFVVSRDFEIVANDYLVLGSGEVVKLKTGVEITVEGTIEFTPVSRATVTRYDDQSQPKSIYMTGEGSGGAFSNVTFIDVPLRVYVQSPLTIQDCEFKYITTTNSAITLGTTSQVTVTNCRFIENYYPAISGGSNIATPLLFKNNYLYKNTTSAGNRPQVNVTVGGNGAVEISGNEIIGPAEVTQSGGIAVSNLLGLSGTNKVLINDNKVRDCRYGITTNGVMDVVVSGNELRDNKYESNAMNGGSGVSIYNTGGGQKMVLTRNIITGHLWGITVIGSVPNGTGPVINMGYNVAGSDYNIGENVLSNNGNGGVLYDLYNNSPLDMYAMNNTWGSVDQTEAEIEKVITHKNDIATLGEVTFMPSRTP